MRRITHTAIAAVLAAGLGLRAGPITPLRAGPAFAAPNSVLLLGTGASGLYRSTDGGQTWQRAGAGLPAGGVWQVLADPAHPDVAYSTTGSVFRGTDAGLHWQPVAGLRGDGPGYTALAAQGGALLAAGPRGIMAGAQHWTARDPAVPGGAPRQLTAAGTHLLYAVSNDGRLYLRRQGDPGWQRLNGLPDAPVTAFTYVPETLGASNVCPVADACVELYAAVASHGVYQSLDSGRTWSQESTESGSLPHGCTVRALLSTDLHTIYAALDGKGLYRSQHSGQFWKPASRGPAITITALAAIGSSVVAATLGQGVKLYTADPQTFVWRGQAVGLPVETLGVSLALVAAPVPVGLPLAHLPGPCSIVAGYPLCEPFRRFYWSVHPHLVIFGNPLGPAIYDGPDKRLIVQYFDRARFEYRPDLPGKVGLAPLGRLLTMGRRFPPTSVLQMPGPQYFPQTGYRAGGPFLAFWHSHGAAAVLGYPISPVLDEPNGDGSNRSYVMQYFENARLEMHPEQSSTPFTVELGLLGRQYLCLRTGTYCGA